MFVFFVVFIQLFVTFFSSSRFSSSVVATVHHPKQKISDEFFSSEASPSSSSPNLVIEIKSMRDVENRVLGHQKPALVLFFDPEQHSSLADVLWPVVAEELRSVFEVASFDALRQPNIAKNLFGVTKLPFIKYFYPGPKLLRRHGYGSFDLDITSVTSSLANAAAPTVDHNEAIFEAEENCETEDELLETNAARDFVKFMKDFARNKILGNSHIRQNIKSVQDLSKLAQESLNQKVFVLFVDDGDDDDEIPLALLLLSSLGSRQSVIAYATVVKSSETGKFLLEKASRRRPTPSSPSSSLVKNFNDTKLWLFSSAFLSGTSEKCENSLVDDPPFPSHDDSIAYILNSTYVERVLKPSCNALAYQQELPSTDTAVSVKKIQPHINFDSVSEFYELFFRPPPSLHTPVPECATFEDCVKNHHSTPFIAKKTKEFQDMGLTFERAVSMCLAAPPGSNKIKGALASGVKVQVSVPEAMSQWLNDTLQGNFLYISPSTTCDWFEMPKVTSEYDVDPSVSHRTLIFTPANRYTGTHSDPSTDGGSWMHLFRGRKLWQFYDPKHFLHFVGNKIDEHASRLPPEIETLSCLAEEGDTVYFPPGWLHRVWTFEKSFGLNSYLTPIGVSKENIEYWSSQQAKARDATAVTPHLKKSKV